MKWLNGSKKIRRKGNKMTEYRLTTSYKNGQYQHKLEIDNGTARDTSFFDTAEKVKDNWLAKYSKKVNLPLAQQAKLNEETISQGKYKTIETKFTV